MEKTLNCVLLVDDDDLTNFLHRIVLEETAVSKNITIAETAKEALYMLGTPDDVCSNPELIFLDLNMPGMDGWDFLQKFHDLKLTYKNNSLVYILTTSVNPDDKKKADGMEDVAGFLHKPLTTEIIEEIVHRHFSA